MQIEAIRIDPRACAAAVLVAFDQCRMGGVHDVDGQRASHANLASTSTTLGFGTEVTGFTADHGGTDFYAFALDLRVVPDGGAVRAVGHVKGYRCADTHVGATTVRLAAVGTGGRVRLAGAGDPDLGTTGDGPAPRDAGAAAVGSDIDGNRRRDADASLAAFRLGCLGVVAVELGLGVGILGATRLASRRLLVTNLLIDRLATAGLVVRICFLATGHTGTRRGLAAALRLRLDGDCAASNDVAVDFRLHLIVGDGQGERGAHRNFFAGGLALGFGRDRVQVRGTAAVGAAGVQRSR